MGIQELIRSHMNSEDVASHLGVTGYELNALEAAWAMWRSCGATMAVRHDVWRLISEELPDMPVRTRFPDIRADSIHWLLEAIAADERSWFEEFSRSDGGSLFVYEILGRNSSWSPGRAFESFGECRRDALEAIGEDESLCHEMQRIVVTKRAAQERGGACFRARLRLDGEVARVVKDGFSEPELHRLPVLRLAEVRLPVPFSDGDLVHSSWQGALVVADKTEERSDRADGGQSDWRGGYSTGVRGGGLLPMFVWEGGLPSMLADFEYCPAERLEGRDELLIPLAALLKGECDIAFFSDELLCRYLSMLAG